MRPFIVVLHLCSSTLASPIISHPPYYLLILFCSTAVPISSSSPFSLSTHLIYPPLMLPSFLFVPNLENCFVVDNFELTPCPLVQDFFLVWHNADVFGLFLLCCYSSFQECSSSSRLVHMAVFSQQFEMGLN